MEFNAINNHIISRSLASTYVQVTASKLNMNKLESVKIIQVQPGIKLTLTIHISMKLSSPSEYTLENHETCLSVLYERKIV